MDIPPGNLTGYRVLDLTTEAGFFVGKLLSDLGADVVKIEPPDGDPARQRGPFVGGTPDPERSILWLTFNTGKRGITLDPGKPRGQEIFLELCRTADVVIESESPTSPRSLSAYGLGYEVLRKTNSRLVVCALTPFGQTGPYSTYHASDITTVAMGGNMHPTGNPDRAPVRCSLPVSHYHGSIEAAVGILFALWGREHSGEGQFVDVSLQEAMVMANMTSPSQFPLTGHKGRRSGAHFRGGQAIFREIWPCRDGHVSFALRHGPARIPGIMRLVEYMDENNMAPDALKKRDWSSYNHNLISQEEADEIESALAAFFRTKTMQELYNAACERNLMLAPANTAREITASRQLAAREFFVTIDYPYLDTRLTYPGALAKSTLGGIGIRGRAPRLGEHNPEIYKSLGIDAADRAILAADGII